MMIKQYFTWLKTHLRNPNKYAELKRFQVFKELSNFELYLVNNFIHKRSYKPDELLFDKDYPLEVVFFIVSGEIEVRGKIHPVGYRILKKNSFIGLIDMFYENIRSSSAKAITQTEALAISRGDLVELIHQNPRMGIKILTAACMFFSRYIIQISSTQSDMVAADIAVMPERIEEIDT